MIKVTVREAITFQKALTNVMQAKLPAKAAYRLSRIAAKLAPEMEAYEKQRYALFQELGTEVADKPGTFEITGPEGHTKLREQLDPLLDEEINIDLDPVTEDMLGNADLTAGDLMMLEKVIA